MKKTLLSAAASALLAATTLTPASADTAPTDEVVKKGTYTFLQCNADYNGPVTFRAQLAIGEGKTKLINDPSLGHEDNLHAVIDSTNAYFATGELDLHVHGFMTSVSVNKMTEIKRIVISGLKDFQNPQFGVEVHIVTVNYPEFDGDNGAEDMDFGLRTYRNCKVNNLFTFGIEENEGA